MEIFRTSIKKAALGIALFALSSLSANAQNYNNGNNYNNDSRYNNGNNNNYNDDNYDQNGDVASYQDFYDALAPYGEWINDPDYGYVWVPDVDRDFRPYYTNGYWAQTEEYGNTWVSNYDWGWAAFHYGRWTYDNSYGWVWIPGTEWAPAWVNWRSSDNNYYGWAPMGPGYDVDYYASNTNYFGPSSWWVFAPQQYLYSNNFYNYVREPRYNGNYLRSSRLINVSQRSNNYSYFAGPRRRDIERSIGRTIPTYRIRNSQRPGSTRIVGSTGINMYRPRIGQQGTGGGQQQVRPQTFRQGRLNIVQGGGRKSGDLGNGRPTTLPGNNAGGGRSQVPQQEPRRGRGGAPQQQGINTLNPQQGNQDGVLSEQRSQQGRQRVQQEQQSANERAQQLRQSQERQRNQQDVIRTQERAQRDQQTRQLQEQNQARQQQEVIRRQESVQREQQTRQLQEQNQARQQQDVIRQQQAQQERSQRDQQRAQQEQQTRQRQEVERTREAQPRPVEAAPQIRQQEQPRARPVEQQRERSGGDGSSIRRR